MRTYYLCFFLCLAFVGFSQQPDFSLVGFATQNGGTTGGLGGTEVYVNNYADLKTYCESSTTYIIYVSGTIDAGADGGSIRPKSNKSIIGVGNNTLLWGVGFTISGYNNIIIRNLRISMQGVTTRVDKSGVYSSTGDEGRPQILTNGGDCIAIQGTSKNIWIDHCELFSEDPKVQTNIDLYDGLIDAKNGSQYITISWCYFHDHHKSHLIGSSDTDVGDRKITFHHNYYYNIKARLPLYRFGTSHIFNNYFYNCTDAINTRMEACVYVEKNYFKNVSGNTVYTKDSQLPGYATLVDNTFDNSKTPSASTCSSFIPSYQYAAVLHTTAQVPTIVPTYAGVGKIGNASPVVSISSPLNNASFVGPATITIQASASDSDGSISKVEFYNGATKLGEDTNSPYSYTWNTVPTGTYTLTAKAIDDKNATSTSQAITITVISATTPTLQGTNTNQTVVIQSAITPMVFTWGNAATDVSYTALPAGLTAIKNTTNKTLTVSGTPATNGSFTVTTIGGNPAVQVQASVTLNQNSVLANWYPFQENPISLSFLSYANASVNPTQDNSAYSATGCTNGALTLQKATGELRIELNSLQSLQIRWFATGGRTLQIMYGTTGTEHTWNSPIQYSSGAYQHNLTQLIPDLVSNQAIVVRIINNRVDGGSLHITDIYVEGAISGNTTTSQTIQLNQGWNLFSFSVHPSDSSIATIFAGKDVQEIKSASAFWYKGQPAAFNSLTRLTAGQGYLVNMNTAGTLTISGIPCTGVLPYAPLGWQLIGYPCTDVLPYAPTPISNYFNTSNCQIIKNFEGYWQPNGTSNSLSNFEPGKAYFLKR
ncbi:MAG TPA: Ig-like domain-containing protein [Bacteroidales bacterium]|nr:Ig-like domain-containing protein [Bacteroidales bacterium]